MRVLSYFITALLIAVLVPALACNGGGDGAGEVRGVAFDWTRVATDEAITGGPGDQLPLAITEGGPGIVAVGIDRSGGDADAAVWTSPDGTNWNRVPHSEGTFGGAGDQFMFDIITSPHGLIAVGSDGFDAAVWRSPDGLEWRKLPREEIMLGIEVEQWMQAVAVSEDGNLIAGGIAFEIGEGNAAVWISSDGLSWERAPSVERVGPAGDQIIQAIAVGPSGLVATGAEITDDGTDAAIWTSEDGLAWSRVEPEAGVLDGPGTQDIRDVIWSATHATFIAVGIAGTEDREDAGVWTSSDGRSWARSADLGTLGATAALAVAERADGRIVAVGAEARLGQDFDAQVWASDDGIFWFGLTAVPLGGPGGQGMSAVLALEDLIIAIGEDDSGGDDDMAIWLERDIPIEFAD